MYKEYDDVELRGMNAVRTSEDMQPVVRAWDFTLTAEERRMHGNVPRVVHVRQIGDGPDAEYVYRRGKEEKTVRGWGMVSMFLRQDGYTGTMPMVAEYAVRRAQVTRR